MIAHAVVVVLTLSDESKILLAVGVLVVFVGLLWWIALRVARRQAEDLARLSRQMGLSREPPGPLPGVPFGAGQLAFGFRFQAPTWVMKGRVGGTETIVFRTHISDAHGGSTVRDHAAFHLESRALRFAFCLAPRRGGFFVGPGDAPKLALADSPAVHFTAIEFPADHEFSRRYTLSGSDEHALRTLFDRDVLDVFTRPMGTKPWLAEPWWVTSSGDWLVVSTRGDHSVPIEDLPEFLSRATDVFRLIAERAAGLP